MKNYNQRLVEVNEVLKNLSKSDYDKLPLDIIQYIQENMDKDYLWTYDKSKSLQEQNLSRDTIIILSFLNMEYLLNEKQKAYIKKIFETNDKIHQEKLKEKYNSDNLFKKKTGNIEPVEKNITNDVALVEYNESIFKKIWNKVFSIFKK